MLATALWRPLGGHRALAHRDLRAVRQNDAVTMTAARALREAVDGVSVEFDSAAAEARTGLLQQLDDYVLPRLADIDAPLVAVVGGSTGAGKSTLVNALVGEPVSRASVIRPTTRQPLLLCNPVDEEQFSDDRVLPSLPRVRSAESSATALRIRTTDALPRGLALLDAPDVDSIDDENRALAGQLLAAADLWLFTTTPARYADALPWRFLHDAAARDIEVAVVLNRVETDARASVTEDLRGMLAAAGLDDARLFTVPAVPGLDTLLPAQHVDEIRTWLHGIAADAAARRAIAARTVAGAMRAAAATAHELADALDRQWTLADTVESAVDERCEEAVRQVIAATSDGRLLRDEVLGRWQDFVGTSDVFRTVERWFSRTVDRAGAFFRGRPAPMREVEVDIENGLHAVLVDAAETAAAQLWRSAGSLSPELRERADADLARPSGDIAEHAARLIREWQEGLVESIREQAGGKRVRARAMSLGLNAITVALMIVVFAATGGLTGGELAIAGGSAVVGQKLLETIFGEDAVRRLAASARQDLDDRVRELMRREGDRWRELVAPLRSGASPEALRAAADEAAHSADREGPR